MMSSEDVAQYIYTQQGSCDGIVLCSRPSGLADSPIVCVCVYAEVKEAISFSILLSLSLNPFISLA